MADNPILDGLNDAQRRAVVHTKGPALILAGAGSGKTRALTHRIANLIDHGVQPWQILAVTFTNKAAGEMKERIKTLLKITEGPDVSGDIGSGRMPVMGTFHSICCRILRRDIHHLGRDRTFSIYDSDDQEKLMKTALRELHIDESELKPKAALGAIGRMKSEAVSAAEAKKQATTMRMEIIAKAYARYQAMLAEANALDFDDLILETVRLLHEHPDVLERYQETWQYLHVDEYQDTNHAQYLFITLLGQKYRNLCVIGDPDQSIYAFRGADIRNILEFEKEYQDAERITLDQNYRSTQKVLTAANGVISEAPNRPKKDMWTERTEGPQVIIQELRDEKAEAMEVIQTAKQLQSEGVPLREQAVLYRTNAQSRLIEEACLRAGLPYRIVGGQKFYLRREIKDVLAYLSLLANPSDTISLLRIINVPSRKIGLTTMQKLQTFASEHNLTLWQVLQQVDQIAEINAGTTQRIQSFVEQLAKARMQSEVHPVSIVTADMLSRIGMEDWLKQDEDGEDRWQNIQELLSVMKKYDHLEPRLSLTSFLEEASLISEVDKLADNSEDMLTLMTLHLCKGLEFDAVTMVGCEEGIFPHQNSMFDREQLEEERRIMYVGMTRARVHLKLMCARGRMLWGQTQSNAPSRFLDDLPPEVVERRSDEVLSAFAWASASGANKARSQGKLEPFRQNSGNDFFQEAGDDDFNQDSERSIEEGARVHHPSFGEGIVLQKRGDVVTVRFGGGVQKTFALSIAPLTLLH